MNIMIYNREKSLKSITKEGQRSIRIDRLGNMSVTTALVYEMQLTDGDTVSLANDEDDPKKWYLCKAADGFPVRIDRVPRRNNKPRSEGEVCYGAKFNSRWLGRKILDCAGVEGPATFMISPRTIELDGNVYYRIITVNPIIRENRVYTRNPKMAEVEI